MQKYNRVMEDGEILYESAKFVCIVKSICFSAFEKGYS